ncbi:hypothetical protein ACTJIJ_11465 [Niabella sp. 22666]|uniref:hypothetical protein n=1 Tax=Niabella sp. 22666 TaxID=3453954 RepID=UPI003F87D046
MDQSVNSKPTGFWKFLKEPKNKRELWVFAGCYLLCFIILRYCYPFPDTVNDSNTYIRNAIERIVGDFRPIGYSYLLYYIGSLSKSPAIFLIVQLIIYFLSIVFVYFSCIYFFKPCDHRLRAILLFFVLAAPSCIYFSNFILSDTYFVSLTNFWVGTLIWILMIRDKWFITAHFFLLFLLFQTRYIALCYPAVSFLCFILAFWKQKISLLLMLTVTTSIFFIFISHTRKKTAENIGVAIFSGFSGWQMANNALHILPYSDTSSVSIEDFKIRTTNQFIVSHFPVAQYAPPDQVTANYIWDANGPLKQYMVSYSDSTNDYLYNWHKTSIQLGNWGNYIIKKNPLLFSKHYLLPNFNSTFRPQSEFLASFSQPSEFAKEWFNCIGCRTTPVYDFYHILFANWMPAAMGTLWSLTLFAIVLTFFSLKRWGTQFRQERNVLFVIWGFVMLYIVMSVYASPIVLRYLLPIRLATIIGIYILINRLLYKKTTAIAA